MSPIDITPLTGGTPPTPPRSSAPPPAPGSRVEFASVEPDSPPQDQVALSGLLALEESQAQSEAAVTRAVEEANQRVSKLSAASVRFEVYEDTGDLVIHVVDRETDELIRQIPPEEILRISESLADLKGLLINSQG